MMTQNWKDRKSETMLFKSGLRAVPRRDFIKAAGALLVAAGAAGCTSLRADEVTSTTAVSTKTQTPAPTTVPSSPTPSASPTPLVPTPSPTPEPQPVREKSGAQVAFVKTNNRAEGVRRALDLLGLNPVDGKTVMLKPNFNSADPPPGSTHDDVLRTLVSSLWDMGAQSITVADRSGMGNSRRVMEQKGIMRMAEELGFDILVLDELTAEDWKPMHPTGSHWRQGFLFPRPFMQADAIVQTCCLKTHRYGGHFTMSLKNSVGMVAKDGPDGYDYMRELHSSPNQRRMIAEINTAYQPALVVMDGVEAFVRGGPARGDKVEPGVVLAGTDRIALDAVGVAILRSYGTTPEVERGRIFEQEQIARAVTLGLGVSRSEDIGFLTDDDASAAFAAQIQEVLLSS